MIESYPARYKDKIGEETTLLHNDGKLLRMVVRGVEFTGEDFDSLAPIISSNSPELSSFTLHDNYLCDCEIECDKSILVISEEETIQSTLHIHVKLGKPITNGGIENEELQLTLNYKGWILHSCGEHGFFEDELLELQKALPETVYMQCCFNCAFSDYFPAGNGMFGNMACFRDNKQEYLKVEDKYDLFRIWETMTEYVQETYLCPEFERRVPGTGYRR